MSDDLRESKLNNGIVLDNFLVIGTMMKGIYALSRQGNLVYYLHAGDTLNNHTVLSLKSALPNKIWTGLDKSLDFVSFNISMIFFARPRLTFE